MQPHPDAGRLETEHTTGLVGVHVEPVHEDERRSQAVGQLLERPVHVVTIARCGSDVGDRDRGEPSLGADGQSPDPLALKVQGRPVRGTLSAEAKAADASF